MEIKNLFIPHLATIKSVINLTDDIKLFTIKLTDPIVQENFHYRPGQFAFISVFGVGEAPFVLTSLCHTNADLEFAIKRVGTVTAALHELEVGETVGVRGPFGNYFPIEKYTDKNIVIIGGGIGMAPLRPVIKSILNQRNKYGELLIIHGARTPKDLLFCSEFESWASSPRTRIEFTVDHSSNGWGGHVALIPDLVRELAPSPKDAIAIICGPPIMIRFTIDSLKYLGFGGDQIVTTLERKMKCGVGKCGRCNIGDKYICQDGPVFTASQISQFLEQF